MTTLLIVIIVLALVFDYINGFHDAANSIATVVSTKVLTPFQAVVWAAVFNFVAYFIFQDHAVANTVGKTVTQNFITLPVIFSGLIAAIFWNLLTWWYGIPSSSSHTLIGGFAGAALTHAFTTKGTFTDVVDLEKIIKTVLFIFLAPLIGMIISAFITLVTIKRNVYLRILIIVLVAIGTWFLFDYFRSNKYDETLTKFFKIDKYEKEISKINAEIKVKPSDEKLKAKLTENTEKLQKAKKNKSLALPFIKDIDKFGDSATALHIAQNVNLSGLEIDKKRDELNKILLVDKLKQDAYYNKIDKKSVDLLVKRIDSMKPIFKKYPNQISDSACIVIAQKLKLSSAQNAIVKETIKSNSTLKQDSLISLITASINISDSLKPTIKNYLKKYPVVISDSASIIAAAKFNLTELQREKLHKQTAKINIKTILQKELSNANNRKLVLGIMILCAVFILVFVFVELINKPTSYKMGNMFKKLQLLSSAAFSIGHGGNDAQKVMGIIAAAFVANGNYSDIGTALKELTWVPLACYAAIGFGTLSGGWKIVKTMGSRITKVTPLEGVSAESAGAITLFMTEQMGIPVSTTHTITGSIIGVGATKRLSAVRWGVTKNLLVAWLLTIPVSALIAMLTYILVYYCGLK